VAAAFCIKGAAVVPTVVDSVALLLLLLLGCTRDSKLMAGDGEGFVALNGLKVCGWIDQHL
jgi:hypothetical protein